MYGRYYIVSQYPCCVFFGYPIVHVFQDTGPITSVSKTKVNAPSHLGYPFTTFLISRIPIES